MRKIDAELLNKRLSETAEEQVANEDLGAAELIVKQEGKTVFHKQFGKMSVNGPALQPNALYRLASMTKPVTALAVLMALDDGKIDLMDPVSDYLPRFAHMTIGHEENGEVVIDKAAAGTIRVYQLLSHLSGIGSGSVLAPLFAKQPQTTLKDVVDFYGRMPLAFEPGCEQSYSASAAFDVAARIVEVVEEEDYAAFLKRRIFDPIGMPDTTFAPSDEQWKRMVVMHGKDKDGRGVDSESATMKGCVFGMISPTVYCAGAGLASTASDYSRFAETLLNEGITPSGERIIRWEICRKMHIPFCAEYFMMGEQQWGLGVRVISKPGYSLGLEQGCYGWSGAYGSHFWVDPENRLTAVYMKNDCMDGGAGCKTGNRFEQEVTSCLKGS